MPDLACPNCDDRRCMGCVFREYDHDCRDDCPFCCVQSEQTSEKTLGRATAVLVFLLIAISLSTALSLLITGSYCTVGC